MYSTRKLTLKSNIAPYCRSHSAARPVTRSLASAATRDLFPRIDKFVDDITSDPSVMLASDDPLDARMIADICMGDGSPACIALAEAYADRIIACCNACSGIPTWFLRKVSENRDRPLRRRVRLRVRTRRASRSGPLGASGEAHGN